MDSGKKQVDLTPKEVETRKRKARREYEIITRQFWPLVAKIDEWLEQHTAPQGQDQEDAMVASDVEDGASARQASTEGLADTIRRYLRELDEVDDDCEASTSGSSLQVADQKPQVPVPSTDAKPDVPAVDQKSGVPPAEPKPEPSSP